ncbi:TraX family protein [uncultured Dysosmobacter sp.]|uniref:TraX family protein n=1 Tax=uncultured Dysosmobacter sp. TaxID=2591384 RepID=UPI002673FEBD|nr:TraX family protein [uncultured Dysosmobacter sp.]
MEKSCGKGLSGFALKYIAMVSMLCDHANFLVIRRGVFAPYTAADDSILIPADAPAGVLPVQRVYGIFEILGHIGFPVFIFLLTEGFLHTRSRKRYLLTLAAFAVLARYSGQRGRRGWKYFFYAFYPAHFLVLLWIGKWIAAQSL